MRQQTSSETSLGVGALHTVERYRRAVNYLAAAQIYLKDNPLLEEPLRPEHIKDRLLGHWGTAPGINLIYAHLNRLILATDASILLITGPGHGAAANLANMYLEGTITEFFADLTRDRAGLERFVKSFSWPRAFPSHLFPGYPGVIHEGGELGYALSTAFGAVLDNPELIVACIVGDGEAETGPTAGAWHSNKFLNPKNDGAVLPILHDNGFKIASPTIFGSMSDAGDNLMLEAMAAADILRQEAPEWRVRVVNVIDLLVLGIPQKYPHGLEEGRFTRLFPLDCPVIFNFHGYTAAIKQLLWERPQNEGFDLNGYREEGTTTTPFDMHVHNRTSRYHLVIQSAQKIATRNPAAAALAEELIVKYERKIADHGLFIRREGVDPPEIAGWKWTN